MTTSEALATMTSKCTCRKSYGTDRFGACPICKLPKP